MSQLYETASSEFAGVSLVLTAGIYYTDPTSVRFETSLLFTEISRDEGVPAVFVDSSPEGKQGTWVADAHRQRGAIVMPATIAGVATQRQQGVAYAISQGAEKIVGTESEKPLIPLFVERFSRALDQNDVLVIGRTPVAENSLPPVQQRTERLAGWILEQTLGLPADTLAGPRGFTVAGAEVLADYPATKEGMNNWLYLYETPLEAQRRGLQVGSTTASFIYPEGMVLEETGNPVFDKKRVDQFELQLGHLLPPALSSGELSEPARSIAEFAMNSVNLLSEGTTAERLEIIGNMEQHFAASGYQPTEQESLVR